MSTNKRKKVRKKRQQKLSDYQLNLIYTQLLSQKPPTIFGFTYYSRNKARHVEVYYVDRFDEDDYFRITNICRSLKNRNLLVVDVKNNKLYSKIKFKGQLCTVRPYKLEPRFIEDFYRKFMRKLLKQSKICGDTLDTIAEELYDKDPNSFYDMRIREVVYDLNRFSSFDYTKENINDLNKDTEEKLNEMEQEEST
jgi:hypothetical protein